MCDILKTLFIVHFLGSCVFISDCYEQIDEGYGCEQLGYVGICKKVMDCEVALDALRSKGRHKLTRCGFEPPNEIVCCPDLSNRIRWNLTTTIRPFIFSNPSVKPKPTENPKNERKSEKMCKKMYSDYKIKPDILPQIINGEDASDGQFPNVAALGFENAYKEIEWKCGASLISSRFLLTAAHCLICNGCTDPKKARIGVIDITDVQNAQDIDVKNSTPHPDFKPISRHNDIGIIELAKDVQMSNIVYPACLYTNRDDPVGLHIAGWGQTVSSDINSKSRILQFAIIQPVPINECNETVTSKIKFSTKVILETQICATTKSDACAGDSGGPLQIQKKEGGFAVVGVVSYGVQCGTTVPGIYTRVAMFLDWIEQNVWPD